MSKVLKANHFKVEVLMINDLSVRVIKSYHFECKSLGFVSVCYITVGARLPDIIFTVASFPIIMLHNGLGFYNLLCPLDPF